jgi:transcriptional regulator with XRE-family HTH domain
MAITERVKEKIITAIDWYVIERVRELRKSKFSQSELSREIGFSDGFIGRIENPNQGAVYSLRHLNLIANALNVGVADLMPKQSFDDDLVKVTIKWKPPTKAKTGEVNYEVVKIVSLTAEEIAEYNKKVLNRPTKSGIPPKLRKRKSGNRK